MFKKPAKARELQSGPACVPDCYKDNNENL